MRPIEVSEAPLPKAAMRARVGGMEVFFCFFLEKAKGKNQSIEDITRGTSVCALLLGFVQPREALRRNETTLTSEDFR